MDSPINRLKMGRNLAGYIFLTRKVLTFRETLLTNTRKLPETHRAVSSCALPGW